MHPSRAPNGTLHRKEEMAAWPFSGLCSGSDPTLFQMTLFAALLATVLGEQWETSPGEQSLRPSAYMRLKKRQLSFQQKFSFCNKVFIQPGGIQGEFALYVKEEVFQTIALEFLL